MFLQSSNLKLSTCGGWFPKKTNSFSPWSGILMDQKCQKMQLVLTCQIFNPKSLPFYLRRFLIRVSTNTLLLEADNSFLNIMKKILYVEIGVLIDQKWQKCYSMLQPVILENYIFEFLYQCLNWQWYFNSFFLEGTIFDFVLSIGILMVRKRKRVNLTLMFRRS